MATKLHKSLAFLSPEDLRQVTGGSGKGTPFKATPIADYLQAHPLPQPTRYNVGPIHHPLSGVAVTGSGGTGQPTNFSVTVSGQRGNTLVTGTVAGSTNPAANQSATIGLGFKFK